MQFLICVNAREDGNATQTESLFYELLFPWYDLTNNSELVLCAFPKVAIERLEE